MKTKEVRLKIDVDAEIYAKEKADFALDLKTQKESKKILTEAVKHGYELAIKYCEEYNSRSGFDMKDYLELLDENGNSY